MIITESKLRQVIRALLVENMDDDFYAAFAANADAIETNTLLKPLENAAKSLYEKIKKLKEKEKITIESRSKKHSEKTFRVQFSAEDNKKEATSLKDTFEEEKSHKEGLLKNYYTIVINLSDTQLLLKPNKEKGIENNVKVMHELHGDLELLYKESSEAKKKLEKEQSKDKKQEIVVVIQPTMPNPQVNQLKKDYNAIKKPSNVRDSIEKESLSSKNKFKFKGQEYKRKNSSEKGSLPSKNKFKFKGQEYKRNN